MVHPHGSSNVSCTGLVSSSGNSTLIDLENATRSKRASNSRRMIMIISPCVAVVGLSGVALATILIRNRRRQHLIAERDTRPAMFEEGGVLLSVSPPDVDPFYAYIAEGNSGNLGEPFASAAVRAPAVPLATNPRQHDSSCPPACERQGIHHSPPFPASPETRAGASARALKARARSRRPRADARLQAGPSADPLTTDAAPAALQWLPSGSASHQRASDGDQEQPDVDVIIQHRDAEDSPVVRELPPPYIDRSLVRPE